MGMVINTNLSALNTYNQLNKNSNLMNKSLQKLSSGYAINTAADDAAGLAISEKMRGQIRGLDQASKNAQNATSLVQTAEGALEETTEILQRMRELAAESASDTNTDDDRASIQTEIDALVKEINNIANTTEFNTKKLLDGSMGTAQATALASIDTNEALNTNTVATSTAITLTDADGNSLGIEVGDTIEISYMQNGTLTTSSVTVTSATTLGDLDVAADFSLTVDASGAVLATATGTGTTNAVYGLTYTVTDSSGDTKTAPTNALSSFAQTQAAADIQKDGSATVLIGANTGQDISINIGCMDAATLGVQGLKVDSQGAADVALKVIDTATATVSTARSQLGAIQNRLEHTVNNLTTTSENLTSAESRIRDVDMASEMAEYTKLNVITQAATAMLAQANQQPQQVLQLLQG